MQGEPAVVRFIQEQKKKGTSEKKIKEMLLKAGWHMDIVNHALKVEPTKRAPTSVAQAKLIDHPEVRKLIKLWVFLVIAVIVLLSL